MLRIIRVRLPTEWACHWRKLYFYLLCRVSLGLPLALSLPFSICTAAELGVREPGPFSQCLKGAVSAPWCISWICISACFHVWAHTICILQKHLYSGVDPSSVGGHIHLRVSQLATMHVILMPSFNWAHMREEGVFLYGHLESIFEYFGLFSCYSCSDWFLLQIKALLKTLLLINH